MSRDAYERFVKSVVTDPTSRTDCESFAWDAIPDLTTDERADARKLLERRLDAPFPEDPRVPDALGELGVPDSIPALRAALERARGSRHTAMMLAVVDALLALGAEFDAAAEYRWILAHAPTLADGVITALTRLGDRSPQEALDVAEQTLRRARTSIDRSRILGLIRRWLGVPATRQAPPNALSILGQRLCSPWDASGRRGEDDLARLLADARRGALTPWTAPLAMQANIDRAWSFVVGGLAIPREGVVDLDEASKDHLRLRLLATLPESPPPVLASLMALANGEVLSALAEAAATPWITVNQRNTLLDAMPNR